MISLVLLTFNDRLLLSHHNFFSVGQFVIISDEAHHCCVVYELNVVQAVSSATVMCHQSEPQRVQDTALENSGVQDDGSRGFVPNSYCLGFISEEVQYPVAHGVLMPNGPSFLTLGDDCIKGGAEIIIC